MQRDGFMQTKDGIYIEIDSSSNHSSETGRLDSTHTAHRHTTTTVPKTTLKDDSDSEGSSLLDVSPFSAKNDRTRTTRHRHTTTTAPTATLKVDSDSEDSSLLDVSPFSAKNEVASNLGTALSSFDTHSEDKADSDSVETNNELYMDMLIHAPEIESYVSESCTIPKKLQKPNLYSVNYEEELNVYLQRCHSIRSHLESIIKAIVRYFDDYGSDLVLQLKRKRFNERLTSIKREIEEMTQKDTTYHTKTKSESADPMVSSSSSSNWNSRSKTKGSNRWDEKLREKKKNRHKRKAGKGIKLSRPQSNTFKGRGAVSSSTTSTCNIIDASNTRGRHTPANELNHTSVTPSTVRTSRRYSDHTPSTKRRSQHNGHHTGSYQRSRATNITTLQHYTPRRAPSSLSPTASNNGHLERNVNHFSGYPIHVPSSTANLDHSNIAPTTNLHGNDDWIVKSKTSLGLEELNHHNYKSKMKGIAITGGYETFKKQVVMPTEHTRGMTMIQTICGDIRCRNRKCLATRAKIVYDRGNQEFVLKKKGQHHRSCDNYEG